MSSSNSIIILQNSYKPYQHVLIPIVIVYFAAYVSIRNHYVFKPRILNFLNKVKINSTPLRNIFIDTVTTLSVITFLFTSIILTSNDSGIRVLVQNDFYWIGICMIILTYKQFRSKDQVSMKVIIKNSIFLLICLALIFYEYFSENSILILGLGLIGVYAVNLIINSYEDSFVALIEDLFNSKSLSIQKDNYVHVNLMQSPEYLSSNFPVSKKEIAKRLQQFQPRLKKIKLKTKTLVTKKLLLLSLAVRISQQKMQAKLKSQVQTYYGGLNGTSAEKGKRLQLQVKNTMISNQQKYEIQSASDVSIQIQQNDQLQVLFTIFPVKIFESSKILSVMFSIMLNLAFGVFLCLAVQISSTLQYGQYLNCLYAFLLLPMLPKVSRNQYLNSMSLTSIWKYALTGIYLIIYFLLYDQNLFKMSKILHFQSLLVIIVLIFVNGMILMDVKAEYKLPILVFVLFILNLVLIFFGSQDQRASKNR